MVTSVEKVEVLFASGRSRAYPVAVEFGSTAVVEFNLDNKLGVTVTRMHGGLLGGNEPVSWIPDRVKSSDMRWDDVEGCSVLVPMDVLRNGKDDVVGVTTSTGSSWVLDGERYVSIAGNGSGFDEPVTDFNADSFALASANEEENEKVRDGRELG